MAIFREFRKFVNGARELHARIAPTNIPDGIKLGGVFPRSVPVE